MVKPHFILVPFFGQGHIIPMLDIARLIASRGIHVSLVLSPVNASRVQSVVDRINKSGVSLQLIILNFPSVEAGLPYGCETLDQLMPDESLMLKFVEAMAMLQLPLLHHIETAKLRPSCIIADSANILWTKHLADELNIPRILFHGPCCFYVLCMLNLFKHNMYQSLVNDSQPFVVPGMLDREIKVEKWQVFNFFNGPAFDEFRNKIPEAFATAVGVVINSFQELEGEFIERYKATVGKKVWTIGPVSLCSDQLIDQVERGNNASLEAKHIVTWLNSMDDGSVIYVSFGSLPLENNHPQLIEIGLGLESSKKPFIWVIKEREWSPEFECWLSESEYEVRVRPRGMIIKGWSPQTLVLSHQAVGAFVTHCGWNSTLEAVAAGVPMVTWPLLGDQFLNEKLVVQVLSIGVEVSAKKAGIVSKEEVENAVMMVLQDKEMRIRVMKFKDEAKKAMEVGGSSYHDLSHMIKCILEFENKDDM